MIQAEPMHSFGTVTTQFDRNCLVGVLYQEIKVNMQK